VKRSPVRTGTKVEPIRSFPRENVCCALQRDLRGYGSLFAQHVTQANGGRDFEFLVDRSETPDPPMYPS